MQLQLLPYVQVSPVITRVIRARHRGEYISLIKCINESRADQDEEERSRVEKLIGEKLPGNEVSERVEEYLVSQKYHDDHGEAHWNSRCIFLFIT